MGDPMAWQAMQLCGDARERARPYNPYPPGVVQPGSGSDTLLRYLRQWPQRWFFHSELVLALGRSKGEVDWAVIFLRRHGALHAEEVEVMGRKPVMRYRWSGKTMGEDGC